MLWDIRSNMLRENLKDSVEILTNILNQPLSISGIEKNISFLQALESFSLNQSESDLNKLLKTFASNPEPTKALIQELQLIAQDLRST